MNISTELDAMNKGVNTRLFNIIALWRAKIGANVADCCHKKAKKDNYLIASNLKIID